MVTKSHKIEKKVTWPQNVIKVLMVWWGLDGHSSPCHHGDQRSRGTSIIHLLGWIRQPVCQAACLKVHERKHAQ